MKKTGYEIIGMIKDGNAPKKIKNNKNMEYEFDKYTKIYSNGYLCLDLIQCLNDDFKIIDDSKGNDEMKNKILKGKEIVLLVADGKAPKKIKNRECDYYWDGANYYDEYGNEKLELFYCLNDEFEILEEPKVWEPKEDEEYWVIQCETIEKRYWNNDEDDIIVYNIGNYFKTKEEAEKALEKIKIYVRLKRYAEEHNTEKIYWTTKRQPKWFICYDFGYEIICIIDTADIKDIGQIYFTSEELARQAIKEIGEENIKKLFEE